MTPRKIVERNLKLVLEYDGSGLSGWQRQKNVPSVQDYLEQALSRLTGERVTVAAAGRTDAGVHARGQVAGFKTSSRLTPEELLRGGNALLPGQITIKSVEEVPPDFHPRFSARAKTYDYYLYVSPVRSSLNRLYAWHIRYNLDLAAMRTALNFLLGEHDFAGFQSTGTPVNSTVRTILAAELGCERDNLVRVTLKGTGFLRHMVRAIVGTLVDVGGGRLTADEFKVILDKKDRALAGETAPAHGLCLRRVEY